MNEYEKFSNEKKNEARIVAVLQIHFFTWIFSFLYVKNWWKGKVFSLSM